MYSRKFLRSIGVYTGSSAFAVGTVEAVEPVLKHRPSIVTINWDGGEQLPNKVNAANLILKSRLAVDAAG